MLFDKDYTRAIVTYFSLRGKTRKRWKTACKASGHTMVDVAHPVWGHVQYRICERCGKRRSAKAVQCSQ